MEREHVIVLPVKLAKSIAIEAKRVNQPMEDVIVDRLKAADGQTLMDELDELGEDAIKLLLARIEIKIARIQWQISACTKLLKGRP